MEQVAAVTQLVEIKTLTLNGKKLTRSIYNQIEFRDCFDSKMNFIGEQHFGYVKDKDRRFLVWSTDGKLGRTNLSYYQKLKKHDDNFMYEDIRWFLDKCKIEYTVYEYNEARFMMEIESEPRREYNLLVDKTKGFLKEVLNQQLYI